MCRAAPSLPCQQLRAAAHDIIVPGRSDIPSSAVARHCTILPSGVCRYCIKPPKAARRNARNASRGRDQVLRNAEPAVPAAWICDGKAHRATSTRCTGWPRPRGLGGKRSGPCSLGKSVATITPLLCQIDNNVARRLSSSARSAPRLERPSSRSLRPPLQGDSRCPDFGKFVRRSPADTAGADGLTSAED